LFVFQIGSTCHINTVIVVLADLVMCFCLCVVLPVPLFFLGGGGGSAVESAGTPYVLLYESLCISRVTQSGYGILGAVCVETSVYLRYTLA
jgi:hypothetical protein